jgi:glycerol transport system ATP-binding protein
VTLELRNVSLRVGSETHIYPTNLTLVEGAFNVFLGTTLAGKTTLMQLMAGLRRPTSGEIWFNGKNVTGVAVQKRNVSMVYQQFINYPNLSVYENIASPLRVTRTSAAEIDKRVKTMAELLKLTPMLGRKPSELSGGQQQRTALARALVKDADLILLDEPLVNLDYKLREELRDELPRLFEGRRCTVVYSTTEPAEALLLGGYTAALHQGRVTQFGPTGEVYRSPADLLTAQVFSEPPINAIAVTKGGGEFRISNGASWSANGLGAALADGRYVIGVRPHLVTLAAHDANQVKIEGPVLITELSGSESVVHFEHAGQVWISQSHGVHALRIGENAVFYLDPARCLYFTEDGRRIEA